MLPAGVQMALGRPRRKERGVRALQGCRKTWVSARKDNFILWGHKFKCFGPNWGNINFYGGSKFYFFPKSILGLKNVYSLTYDKD